MGPLLTEASVPSQCDTQELQAQSPPWTHIPSQGTSLLSKPTSRSTEASFCWHLATRPAATAGTQARSWHSPGRTLPRQPERVRLNHCPQPGKKNTEREIWGLVPAPPQISCAASGSTLSGRSAFLPVSREMPSAHIPLCPKHRHFKPGTAATPRALKILTVTNPPSPTCDTSGICCPAAIERAANED